jgi:carboxyl-terminal processing protease
MRRFRPSPLTIVLGVLAPVLLVLGIWLGGHPEHLPGFARDALGDKDDIVLAQAMDTIEDDYVNRIPRAKLNDAAIKGAVDSLPDQFSSYFSAKEYAAFEDTSHSRFSGVGLNVVGVAKGLRISRVYDGSPAATSGLKVDDVILAAGGRSLKGLSEDAAVARVKGPAGSDVRLRLERGSKVFERTVTRATVSVPAVESKMLTDPGADDAKVGYVALASFSSGAHAEVYAAVQRLLKQGAKGLILDLRDNPGGLVSEAQLVASGFLADGTVVSTRGRNVTAQTLSATGAPVAKDQPMVVLVNRGTASAAEIVTGALKDRDRAEVVGTRTFGKGVFQEIIPLTNGGALDITVGQYFTPNGTNLGKGLKPGAGIRPDVEATDDPDKAGDEVERAGLRVLAPELR